MYYLPCRFKEGIRPADYCFRGMRGIDEPVIRILAQLHAVPEMLKVGLPKEVFINKEGFEGDGKACMALLPLF